jgi:hypothetical protein
VNDLHRLPSRNNHARLLAAIQQSQLQILRGATDSTNRQVMHTDKHRGSGTPPGGADRSDSAGAQQAGDTRAGEVNNDGCAAASNER